MGTNASKKPSHPPPYLWRWWSVGGDGKQKKRKGGKKKQIRSYEKQEKDQGEGKLSSRRKHGPNDKEDFEPLPFFSSFRYGSWRARAENVDRLPH